MTERNTQRIIPGILAMAPNTDVAYYRAVNEESVALFGGRPNALRVVLCKIDFAAFVDALRGSDAARAEALIAEGLKSLKAGGADFAVVTANGAGAIADRVARTVGIPLLKITEPVCWAMARVGVKRAGLLAVRETYRSLIYQTAARDIGVNIIEPSDGLALDVDTLILEKLIHGEFTEAGAQVLLAAITELEDSGAEAVILGCTDLTHLVPLLGERGRLPMFDSTRLHAQAAAASAMAGLDNWGDCIVRSTIRSGSGSQPGLTTHPTGRFPPSDPSGRRQL
jgi:aspartate racemase